ncbi:atp-dependent dna helicase pif1 [Stemphylium lycopersici]|nr:atp-dependent dna helicase pif1 [Stemphylium lycopersici]
MSRTGPRQYLNGSISIPLKDFFPLSSSPTHRSFLHHFVRKLSSSRPLTVAAVTNHRQPPVPARRKNQSQRSAQNKRQRTDTLVAPQGPQQDPAEIESSPAPGPPTQRASIPRLQLPVKEWGLRVEPHAKPPGKFWAWLEQYKVRVSEILNIPKGRAYLASIGKASKPKPQRGQSSSRTQETSGLSQARSEQTATAPNYACSSFSGLHAGHSEALLLDHSVPSGKNDLQQTTQDASQQLSASSNPPQSSIHHDTAVEMEITLDPDQEAVIELIIENHNVFYTGPAGCGKSAILKVFKRQLEAQGKRVFVIAPTNLAALAVRGRTTYKYAGWPANIGKFSLKWLEDSCVNDDGTDSAAAIQFQNTDVLVVDEISMIENNFFERLSRIMKAARKSEEAFGGVQIIVTGDECNFKHVNLTRIHRQADKKFISILQRIRLEAEITPEDGRILLDHHSDTTDAVEIFPKRENVGMVNRQRIERLSGESVPYKCKDFWLLKKHHKGNISLQGFGSRRPSGELWKLEKHRYEPDLELKTNMRIVLLHNLAPKFGLVNGSQGKIVKFEGFDETKLPRKGHGLDGAHT